MTLQYFFFFFFFSSRRRSTRFSRDWSSDVCSYDLELHLHDREVVADALPRAAAERPVLEPVPALGLLRREAVRVETLRVVPEIQVALGDVRAEVDVLARLDPVAVDHVVLDRGPQVHPDRRIHAQRLLDHAPGV